MRLKYLEEVPSCCTKKEFGQDIIQEFFLSGKPAAIIDPIDGIEPSSVMRTYLKLRQTAMRLCGEKVSIVKRGHNIYLRRNEEKTGGN